MSENNIPNLPDEILKKMEAVDKILQKEKDLESVTNIKNDYLADEKKKMLWENGFGDKLQKNPNKVNDQEWIADQLSLAAERIALKVEASQLKEQAREEVNESVPATPGSIAPAQEAKQETFDNSTMDIFNNKEFLDKLDKGHRTMLEINKPGKVPDYKK